MRSIAFLGVMLVAHGLVGCGGVGQQDHDDMLANFRKAQQELLDTKEKYNAQVGKVQELQGRIAKLEGERGTLTEKLAQESQEKQVVAGKLDATQQELEEIRKAREAARKRAEVYRGLLDRFRPLADAGVHVEQRAGYMRVRVGMDALFRDDKPRVKTAGKELIAKVAAILKDIPDRDFLVTAHWDGGAIKRKSEWDHTAEFAVAVADALVAEGVPADRLAAAGFGRSDPIGSGSDAGAALDKRIEIVVMPLPEDLGAIAE